ncbi:MAG: anti-anti-sigma factor [Firmicutes bacterium HGW-Firmicutes-15]|nr:MAG: anti-anti-sigma factor [Firmicutes bacterium HGW-Firmicutes-15]
MNIKETKMEKATVLMIEGRLDSSTSGVLEKKFLAITEAGEKNFVVDFASMDYISSAGLRVLLMAAKKTKKVGGKVVLSALSANVKEVFDIAGFTSIFTISASKEEAIQSI